MDDKSEPLPWDYFLSEYERDLLRIPIEEAMRKYPGISREQMTDDLRELVQNHEQFMINSGQND